MDLKSQVKKLDYQQNEGACGQHRRVTPNRSSAWTTAGRARRRRVDAHRHIQQSVIPDAAFSDALLVRAGCAPPPDSTNQNNTEELYATQIVLITRLAAIDDCWICFPTVNKTKAHAANTDIRFQGQGVVRPSGDGCGFSGFR